LKRLFPLGATASLVQTLNMGVNSRDVRADDIVLNLGIIVAVSV